MSVIDACVVATYFGLAFGINRGYFFNVSDVCYEHKNDFISDVYDIMSLTECSTVCAKDNCRSLLFGWNTHRCITYAAHASFTTPGCGWKYAEIDTARSHVTCDVPGYSYDPSKDSCVINCMTYGTTFGTYIAYVSGYNSAIEYGKSKTGCMAACIAASAFVCRSADFYRSSGVCNMSNETAQTQPSSYLQDSRFDHLHRNCA